MPAKALEEYIEKGAGGERVNLRQRVFRDLSVSVILVTISCSPEKQQRPEQNAIDADQSATIALTMQAVIKNKLLTVSGSTDLPDGTYISYEVRHEGAATRTDVPIENMLAEGNAKVENSKYAADVDLSKWPNGEIEIWAAFQTILAGVKQPEGVLSRFGELGQNLTGPNVSVAGQMKRVELTQMLRLKQNPIPPAE